MARQAAVRPIRRYYPAGLSPMLATALAAGVIAVFGAQPASANAYCVACFEPDAVYRCMVKGQAEGVPPDPRHQIQCIKELAQQGGHARCSVERFSAQGCDGPVKVIDPNAAAVPPPVDQPAEVQQDQLDPPAAVVTGDPEHGDTQPVEEEAAPAKPKGPPRTVEELAKSTAESTKKGLEDVGKTVTDQTKKAGDQIEGAGSALGNAAKKTWDCLSSFFGDC